MTKNLEDLRLEILDLDFRLVKILEKRAKISTKIGYIKTKENLKINVKSKEDEILNSLKKANKNLDQKYIEEIYEIIFHYSKKLQNSLAKN